MSKFLHGFFRAFLMDLLSLFSWICHIITWLYSSCCICQSCDMYVLHFAKQNRAETFCCYCSSFLLLPKTESLFCFHLFCIILSLSCNLILIFWYLSAFLLSPASHPSHLKAISPVTGQTLYVSVNAFVQSPFYFFCISSKFVLSPFCFLSFLLHLYFILTSQSKNRQFYLTLVIYPPKTCRYSFLDALASLDSKL